MVHERVGKVPAHERRVDAARRAEPTIKLAFPV